MSKANMSNQLTRFIGKIPIRSLANDRQWKALSVLQKQKFTSGFRYLEAPKEVGKACWMCWLFLFDFHLCSVRWLWFAHARPGSGSKFSAQCFSITEQWCENLAYGIRYMEILWCFGPGYLLVGKPYVFFKWCTSRQHRGTRHDLRSHIGTGTRCLSTDEEHNTIRLSLHICTVATKSN